jgi:hypothetical protein
VSAAPGSSTAVREDAALRGMVHQGDSRSNHF